MTGKRRFALTVAIGVLAVAIAACAPDTGPFQLDRAPRPVGTPAPDYGDAELSLPQSFADARVLDPGWDVPPQETHGIYLAPRAEEDRVAFTAVSAEGTVLWTADRPLLCSAFAVTAGDDGPLAILMDIAAGDTTMSETTVSAYDLWTGAERWGPVDVPGPHVGPGLVFAAPPPEAMGSNGPSIALDATTGDILADESQDESLMILGEHDGIALLADDTRLIARTADVSELWTLPFEALDHHTDIAISATSPTIDEGIVLLADGSTSGALVELTTGTIIAHGVRGVALDRSTGSRIVLDVELRAFDHAGHVLWSRELPADATLLSAGDGVVYVRTTAGIDVFDTSSGDPLLSLPSDAAVPQHIDESGAGIVGAYDQPLLFTRSR